MSSSHPLPRMRAAKSFLTYRCSSSDATHLGSACPAIGSTAVTGSDRGWFVCWSAVSDSGSRTEPNPTLNRRLCGHKNLGIKPSTVLFRSATAMQHLTAIRTTAAAANRGFKVQLYRNIILSSNSTGLGFRARGMATISTVPHVVPPLKDRSLLREQAYVNGKWVPALSGKTFPVTDPASTLEIGVCPEMAVEDVRSAISAAQSAFQSFRTTTARERSRMLRRWYDLVMQNSEDLATLITWENGKPTPDAKGEVNYAAGFLEWFSEEAPRVYGDNIPASIAGNRIVTTRQPVGVCGIITPWNFPAAMITRKVGPAIAAGCTIVAKAPSETPFTALALAELAHRAGIPPGVFNVVTAHLNTSDVGKELCANPVVKKISFTGSTPVGRILMEQCAPTLKRLSFELGGNAPFIVFDDADVDAAVAGAITAKFRSSGQTCVCANRIYVQSGIAPSFSAKFAEKVRAFTVGGGYAAGVTHGPLISPAGVKKAHSHVSDALALGAKLVVGGEEPPHTLGPNFYGMTVLTGMTKGMKLSSEETFGPVAGIFEFETEEEVVRLANEAEVGLAGYFYSKDAGRIWRVAEALEVGMVGINTGLISDPAAPFGGVKQSGFGREGSKYGIDEYTNIKMITFGGV